MDEKVRRDLAHGHVVDITTTGRKSGEPRRIEIVFHNIGGRLYISGQPRPQERAWLSNLKANPRFTLHLKGPVKADLPATARVITDEKERRQVLTEVAKIWKRDDVDRMVKESPLIEVTVDDRAA
ncbi:MAG TPA: nitroreductase family deazaflavin-dependent oxidoreductase [Candidatus Dormibacteraeota bacterium]|jgi:deazaflavin-dependent oxidoreductase (nitroreductase family)